MKNYSQKLFLICLVAFLSGCSGNNSKPGSSSELPSYSEISSWQWSQNSPSSWAWEGPYREKGWGA